MATGYTKDFLVSAFMYRFERYNQGTVQLQKMAENFYDEVGKDKFRVYASLDAAAVKEYAKYVSNI